MKRKTLLAIGLGIFGSAILVVNLLHPNQNNQETTDPLPEHGQQQISNPAPGNSKIVKQNKNQDGSTIPDANTGKAAETSIITDKTIERRDEIKTRLNELAGQLDKNLDNPDQRKLIQSEFSQLTTEYNQLILQMAKEERKNIEQTRN